MGINNRPLILMEINVLLVHVWTVLVKTVKKYVWAKLDTLLPRALEFELKRLLNGI